MRCKATAVCVLLGLALTLGCGRKDGATPIVTRHGSPSAGSEELFSATESTLNLLSRAETLDAGGLVERVRVNAGLIADADRGQALYDDLLAATYSCCAILLGATEKPATKQARDAQGDVDIKIHYIQLSALLERIIGVARLRIHGDLTTDKREYVERLFVGDVLPRLSSLHELKLEAQGPFAEALAQYETVLRDSEEAFAKFRGAEALPGSEGEDLTADEMIQRVFGSLEIVIQGHAMQAHFNRLLAEERLPEFARAYHAWLQNPMVASWAPIYEVVVSRRIGLRRAAGLDCFQAYDESADKILRELREAPTTESGKVLDELRGVGNQPVSRFRAVRRVVAGSRTALIAVFLDSATRESWKPVLSDFKHEIRDVFAGMRQIQTKRRMWRVWNRLWGDAEKQLGLLPESPPRVIPLDSNEAFTITVQADGSPVTVESSLVIEYEPDNAPAAKEEPQD